MVAFIGDGAVQALQCRNLQDHSPFLVVGVLMPAEKGKLYIYINYIYYIIYIILYIILYILYYIILYYIIYIILYIYHILPSTVIKKKLNISQYFSMKSVRSPHEMPMEITKKASRGLVRGPGFSLGNESRGRRLVSMCLTRKVDLI